MGTFADQHWHVVQLICVDIVDIVLSILSIDLYIHKWKVLLTSLLAGGPIDMC